MKVVNSSWAWFVLVAMLTGYFTLLLAMGGHHAWGKLGFGPLSPGFVDLRSITSGWDCARQHLGTWPNNPCDVIGRPENYPRIWMVASVLGLGEDDTYLVGSVMAVAFFVAAILALPRQAPVGHALVYGFALCSPAVMLGVERGNVDIALFAMVTAAGLLMRRMPYGPPASSALILLAATLKLFPIAAIGMLTGLPRRTAAIYTSAVGGLFAIYAAATLGDIKTINRVLPQEDLYSYGLHIVGSWLGRLQLGPGGMWDIAIVLLTLVGAFALRRRIRIDTSPSRELDFFCAGAGIYVATFALLRSFDYRLVFLLLTIPQLIRWAAAVRALAIATLGGVLGTLWLPSPWSNVPVLNDVIGRWNQVTLAGGSPLPIAAPAQLMVFVGLAVLLAVTLQANWDHAPTKYSLGFAEGQHDFT
jgi:glycosyl transferase family 87